MSFKATYLRVLTSSPPDKADWWAAKEMIDAGYATGNFITSKTATDYGEVTILLRFKPTVSGRVFADELADQIKRQSWRHRLVSAGLGIGGVVVGWLGTMFSDVGKAYLMQLLGL